MYRVLFALTLLLSWPAISAASISGGCVALHPNSCTPIEHLDELPWINGQVKFWVGCSLCDCGFEDHCECDQLSLDAVLLTDAGVEPSPDIRRDGQIEGPHCTFVYGGFESPIVEARATAVVAEVPEGESSILLVIDTSILSRSETYTIVAVDGLEPRAIPEPEPEMPEPEPEPEPEMPGAEMPGAEMPGAEIPGAEMPGAEMPEPEMPEPEMPVEMSGSDCSTFGPQSTTPLLLLIAGIWFMRRFGRAA